VSCRRRLHAHVVRVVALGLGHHGAQDAGVLVGQRHCGHLRVREGFVTLDERVLRVTGKPTSSRLRLTRPFRYAFRDRTGEAEFTFRSVTSGGTYDVRVQLEKQGGRWQVQRAEVRPESGEPTAIGGERN
jgi:hypothetical protein